MAHIMWNQTQTSTDRMKQVASHVCHQQAIVALWSVCDSNWILSLLQIYFLIKWKVVLKQDIEMAFNLFFPLGEISFTIVFQDNHGVSATAVPFQMRQHIKQNYVKIKFKIVSSVHWLQRTVHKTTSMGTLGCIYSQYLVTDGQVPLVYIPSRIQ